MKTLLKIALATWAVTQVVGVVLFVGFILIMLHGGGFI